MRHQLKRPVQSVHLAAANNRPLTPQQPLWQGPPPPGVDAILTRDALAEHFRDGYVTWASNFALLSPAYLAEIHQQEAARIKAKHASHVWHHFKIVGVCCADVDEDTFWLIEQAAGWTIERGWESKGDVRVLTIANMPVLCPDLLSARRLALACYPDAKASLIWHPIS
jgi:hypothetical protein